MISSRRTRLVRVTGLGGFRAAIVDLIRHEDLERARSLAVLVPTRAAAEHLRRSLERVMSPGRALGIPDIVTRGEWYTAMHVRLGAAPPMLSLLEREVLAAAACRDAEEAGHHPPFVVRPGLIAKILEFYDTYRRHRRSTDDFERVIGGQLAGAAEGDRGAERLLRQTRFFAALLQAYEARRVMTGALDEHSLRERILAAPPGLLHRHVVVTVGDRQAEPPGLYDADFDLLTRIAGLEQIDVIATEETLAAGFHRRLLSWLPGIDEEVYSPPAGETKPLPHLVVPAGSDAPRHFSRRDREQEIIEIARTIKHERLSDDAPPLDRVAVVYRRPLPYVYLGRTVFEPAGIPYEAADALPLAGEPYAAALDLVLLAATSGCTRASLVALLRSPMFSFWEGEAGPPVGVDELDRALTAAGYLGGLQPLATVASTWTGGLAATAPVALAVVEAIEALDQPARATAHLERLETFVRTHEKLPAADDWWRDRSLRARRAVLGAIASLRAAHARFDDPEIRFDRIASVLRRWIERQTFTPRAGRGGVQFLDAAAAPYADLDVAFVVGLVAGEWPATEAPNVFYPSFLLRELGWPSESVSFDASCAAFNDLLRSPRQRVCVSAFQLEADAIVEPSPLVEELEGLGLALLPLDAPAGRILPDEALSMAPVSLAAVTEPGAKWAALRLARTTATDGRFHGSTGRLSVGSLKVTAIDRYLECPFRFFASEVLDLDEEPEELQGLTPRDEGKLLHNILRAFLSEWRRQGYEAVTPSNLAEARALFERTTEDALERLGEADRQLFRLRLLGSPTSPGIAEILCGVEVGSGEQVVERLLEYPLDGQYLIKNSAGIREVSLRGRADRIDVLEGRRLRLYDYKLGRASRDSVQLATYAVCAEQRLARERGGEWKVVEATYLAFGEREPESTVLPRRGAASDPLGEAQERVLVALDGIEKGEFPPRPTSLRTCSYCSFARVCRKDYVADQEPGDDE